MEAQIENWRRCSKCKREILFGTRYWICNVSTCNQKKTNFIFCSVECWDAHVPSMNHRESWAIEKLAPKNKGALSLESKDAEKKEEQTETSRATLQIQSPPAKATVIRRPG